MILFPAAGILKLPKGAKFGVYIAYIFYYHLFKKIEKLSFDKILAETSNDKNSKIISINKIMR